MKNLFFAVGFGLFFCAAVLAQSSEISIVPQPKSLKRAAGEFKLNFKTKIVATDETGRKSAGILNDLLLKNYGFKLEYTDKPQKNNAVVFDAQNVSADAESAESYNLNVSPQTIRIGGGEIGQFYALQTLMQLLPVEFKGEAKLPAVDIADAPRFKYRGLHLDVSRHFMPLSFVKKYIDLMAQYKFNQFHWHLTDDQGWRIEIKKYPRLTEIGSKRPESHEGRYSTVFKGDGRPVEGFYTQDEIRDVVAYAKDRKINVIPEIELPGHASAALAAYPELGCKENFEYKVQQTWGVFKEIFCPKDVTFKFLEDVLDETIKLFPDSPYIHIGGDEVPKDHWVESAFVQELKRKENLKDEHEVQSYFIRRIEKFVNSKGKKIIGWDEILEGGLAPNATVMSWRGTKGGIEAAKSKHDVIMTPTDYLYLDYGQGDQKTEPLNIGGYLPLEKVYSYDPHPAELTDDEKKYILGAQANVWSEYLEQPANIEYMVFPRALALAEVVWSPVETKNFADFQKRLMNQFPRLDRQKVNYRIPAPAGLENRIAADNVKQTIELKPMLENAKVFYTLDGSEPSEKSNLYQKNIIIGLNENQKTDLKTIVVNEKGRKSSVYSSLLWRREWLSSDADFEGATQGMNFAFFTGEFKSVTDFGTKFLQNTGEAKSIDFKQLGAKENFGVVWEGHLQIPADEIYEFWLESKDGARLTIGGEKIIDADGVHEKKAVSGEVPLKKGFHRFRLEYFNTAGEPVLNLRFAVKGQPLRGGVSNQIYR